MEIMSFDNKEKWIDIHGDFKVLVDYPTQEQIEKLDAIRYKDKIQLNKEKNDSIELDMPSWNRYVRNYLKYTIKDWKNLTGGGVEIKCIVENNELNTEQWERLIAIDDIVSLLYSKISDVLRFNEVDKKKFT